MTFNYGHHESMVTEVKTVATLQVATGWKGDEAAFQVLAASCTFICGWFQGHIHM